jgi:hypothetical protein
MDSMVSVVAVHAAPAAVLTLQQCLAGRRQQQRRTS